jgi:hypothetical protein
MKRTWTCATLFAAAAAMPLVVLAAPLVSPAAGSDIVLSTRDAPSGELRLQYRKESDHGAVAETVSVGISSDYHYIQSSDQLRVYDYKLRRIFSVRHGDEFVNNSLYADVWFRAMEIRNRAKLARVFKGAGVDLPPKAASTNEPFWAASELGMVSQDMPRPELKQVSDKNRVRWLVAGDEVAAVRYEKDQVPDSVRGSLRRFWASFTSIYPDIADALAKSNHIPAELWVKQKAFNKDAVVVHWTMTTRRWEPAAVYPVPSHLTAHATLDAGLYPEIFATLSAATSEKKTPPAQETYTLKAEAAIGKGEGLEAMGWLIEMSLAQGRTMGQCAQSDPRPYCTLALRAGPLAKSDPRTAVAFAPNAPDETDRPQFGNLPNAYLLRLLWATRPPGKGVERSEGERDLLAALRASPIANFCKDTGDFYAAQWEPLAAWQVWDFGRLMAGHMSGDLLEAIDTVEANLVAGEPAFF